MVGLVVWRLEMKSYPFRLPQHQHSPAVQSTCADEYFKKYVSLLLQNNKGCESQRGIQLREKLKTVSRFFVLLKMTLLAHF